MNKIQSVLLYLLMNLGKKIPDYYYLKAYIYLKEGKNYNLKTPTTFNEKINWLKLYERNPLLTICADKLKAREFVTEKIGNEYLIPLLWSGNDSKKIPFDKLPNSFVLKTNNASGTNIIVENKEEIHEKFIIDQFDKWLERDYFLPKREWAYKNIPPMIVCEEFIEQGNNQELRDYRFFCFNGEPKFVTVDFSINDKQKTRRNLYNLEWELLDEEISYPKELDIVIEKPEKFEEMIELSKILSKNFPHVRIDFYYIDNKIFFGEMTFYHQSGMADIKPEKFNEIMGSWIKLPIK